MEFTRRSALGLVAAAVCGLAFAQQEYPVRRIEIIVPFPAGGTADFLARVIGQKLADAWSQPVVISNKPGATGSLGAEAAAHSAPDGHTLLVTSYANRKVLFTPELPVADPARDLVPVVLLMKASSSPLRAASCRHRWHRRRWPPSSPTTWRCGAS